MLKKMFSTHSGYQVSLFHLQTDEKIVFSVKGVAILFVIRGKSYFEGISDIEVSEEDLFFISEPEKSFTLYPSEESEVLIVQFPELSILYSYLFSDIAFIKSKSIHFFYSLPSHKSIKDWVISMVNYINSYCIYPFLIEIKISELLIIVKTLTLHEDILLFYSFIKRENQLM